MRLFDAHCHLEEEAFDEDREEVISRAIKSGIIGIVTSPIYPEDAEKALSLFRDHQVVKVSIGLDVAEYGEDDEVEKTIQLILDNVDDIVAVGEVGLDYRVASRGGPDKDRQKEVFRRFIRLAKELDKPLVIHSLWAQRPVLRVLDEEGASRVVLHAFGGKPDDIKFAVERGWVISIPTNVVRSENIRRVAECTPVEVMVLESDSPVLAPNPRERNEPANIRVSLTYISKLKGYCPEDLASITTDNARKVYELWDPV
ncbi:MAG: TatD family hydrolase [Candidatus Korarchaeota archaeon]|nr:TatD family hydrolase [Candidatus Korarchaeota archaeon]